MSEWWSDVTAWMVRHDLQVDLATVWCLAVGFAVLSLVEGVSWWTIRGTHDSTDVGRELKWKKASSAVVCLAMSVLYSLTLYGYYQSHAFGYWERLWVRAFVVAGLVGACFHGTRFVVSLRRERGRLPLP